MSDFSDSASVLSRGKTRWKLEKGKYRVTFAALPIENGDPQFTDENGNPTNPSFKGARRLYKQDVGYFIDHDSEYQKLEGQPSVIATTLVFWPTDANGNVDASRLQKGEDVETMFEVRTWVLSEKKYLQLEGINNESPLSHHDVEVTVTDAHKISFVPCRESLFKALSEKDPKTFKACVKAVQDAHNNLQNDIEDFFDEAQAQGSLILFL